MGIGQFIPIEFDASLGDEAAGFRVTGDGFGFLDKFGDGEGGGGGAEAFHLGGGEVFLRELGFEIVSGGSGGFVPVEATDGGCSEFFFSLHGMGWGLFGQAEEGAEKIAPKGTSFIRNRHDFTEDFGRWLSDADVILE